MKYLCLIRAESAIEQMTEPDVERHLDEYRVFVENIRASGHYLGCNRLLPPWSATTVRVRNGRTLITDGPWTETKEVLGGPDRGPGPTKRSE